GLAQRIAVIDDQRVLHRHPHFAPRADDLRDGRLVRVLPRYAPPPRPAHVVYLPDRRHAAKVRCFVDHVLEHLG
ncbi:MAG: LysR family transcriptional regulator, partial [Comamonadaceae bacterium]